MKYWVQLVQASAELGPMLSLLLSPSSLAYVRALLWAKFKVEVLSDAAAAVWFLIVNTCKQTT